MNTYGQRARDHWARWLPARFSMIDDPETFFTRLGQEAAAREEALVEAMEHAQTSDLATLGYLERVGRLNTIRVQARQQVLAEMLELEPEPGTRPDPEMDEPDVLAGVMRPDGMPVDPDHPLWAMQADDEVSTEDFLAAARAWQDSLDPQRRGPITP